MKRANLLAILAGAVAFGHHSFQAMYLMDQRAAIEGTVAEFQFRNPHTIVLLDVGAERWRVEWGGACVLASQGVRRDTLKPGDRLSIEISPSKPDHPRHGLVRILRRTPSEGRDGFEWGTRPGEVPMEWLVLGQ